MRWVPQSRVDVGRTKDPQRTARPLPAGRGRLPGLPWTVLAGVGSVETADATLPGGELSFVREPSNRLSGHAPTPRNVHSPTVE
jgi:hypothetical protein